MALVFGTTYAVISDLRNKYELRLQAFRMEQGRCMDEYRLNRCEPEFRAPALHDYCTERELCIQNSDEAMVSFLGTVG